MPYFRIHTRLYEQDPGEPPADKPAKEKKKSAFAPGAEEALKSKANTPLMPDLTGLEKTLLKQVALKYLPQLSTQDMQISEQDFRTLALKGVKKDGGSGRDYEKNTALFPTTIDQAVRQRMADVIVKAAAMARDTLKKNDAAKATGEGEIHDVPEMDKWIKENPEWYIETEQKFLNLKVEPTAAVEPGKDQLLADLDDDQQQQMNAVAKAYMPKIMATGADDLDDIKATLRNEFSADLTSDLRDRMVDVLVFEGVDAANKNSKLLKAGKKEQPWKPIPQWWVEAEKRYLQKGDPKKEALRFMLQNSTPIAINTEQLPEDKREQLVDFLNDNFPESNAKMLMKTDPIAALGITVYRIATEDDSYNIVLYPAKGKGWLNKLPDKLNPGKWMFSNKWAILLVDNLRNWMKKGVVGRNAGESELRMAVAYSRLPPDQCLTTIGKMAGVAVPTPEQIAKKVRRNVIKKTGAGGIEAD